MEPQQRKNSYFSHPPMAAAALAAAAAVLNGGATRPLSVARARHRRRYPSTSTLTRARAQRAQPQKAAQHGQPTKGSRCATQPTASHAPFAASAAQTKRELADNPDATKRPVRGADRQTAQGQQSNPQNPGVGDHRQFFWTLRFQCERTCPCRMSTHEVHACTHAAARDARSRASVCGKHHGTQACSMQPMCSPQVQAQPQLQVQSPPRTQPQPQTQPADADAASRRQKRR